MPLKTRECETIQDLLDLLTVYRVARELKGETILFTFPDHEEFQGTTGMRPQFCETPELIGHGRIDKGDSVSSQNFARVTSATVSGLVNSPQFWRCTTTADQITRFKLSNPHYQIVKITKRANEPLTMHFPNTDLATKFFNLLGKLA